MLRVAKHPKYLIYEFFMKSRCLFPGLHGKYSENIDLPLPTCRYTNQMDVLPHKNVAGVMLLVRYISIQITLFYVEWGSCPGHAGKRRSWA